MRLETAPTVWGRGANLFRTGISIAQAIRLLDLFVRLIPAPAITYAPPFFHFMM